MPEINGVLSTQKRTADKTYQRFLKDSLGYLWVSSAQWVFGLSLGDPTAQRGHS